jgi:hypothetical protein
VPEAVIDLEGVPELLGVCVGDRPLLRVVVGVLVLLGVLLVVPEDVILPVAERVCVWLGVLLGVPERLAVLLGVLEGVVERLGVLEGVPVLLGVWVGVPLLVPVGERVGVPEEVIDLEDVIELEGVCVVDKPLLRVVVGVLELLGVPDTVCEPVAELVRVLLVVCVGVKEGVELLEGV